MSKAHPVEAAIARMSPRDQEIANELAELGYSDEDLYAALPNPRADKLLRGPLDAPTAPKKKRVGASGQSQEGGK